MGGGKGNHYELQIWVGVFILAENEYSLTGDDGYGITYSLGGQCGARGWRILCFSCYFFSSLSHPSVGREWKHTGFGSVHFPFVDIFH